MKDYLKPHVLKLTFMINMLFLFWHAVLLAVFGYEEIWIMTGFNVFSVLVYIYTLLALRKHRTRGVIQMMYVELLFHMIVSVICMGWECGFQEYAFGILPIVLLGITSRITAGCGFDHLQWRHQWWFLICCWLSGQIRMLRCTYSDHRRAQSFSALSTGL